MVPDLAKAVVSVTHGTLEDEFEQFTKDHNLQGSVMFENNVAVLTLEGKSAHAMEPNEGINA